MPESRLAAVQRQMKVVTASMLVIALLLVAVIALRGAARDSEQRDLQLQICASLEDFAEAEEAALEAIFAPTVNPADIERGRAAFNAQIEPALEKCRR